MAADTMPAIPESLRTTEMKPEGLSDRLSFDGECCVKQCFATFNIFGEKFVRCLSR